MTIKKFRSQTYDLLFTRTGSIDGRSMNKLVKIIANAKSDKLQQINDFLTQSPKKEKITMKKFTEQYDHQKVVKEMERIQRQNEEAKVVITRAFNGIIGDAEISYKTESVDEFFTIVSPKCKNFISERLAENRNIKTVFTFVVNMKKIEIGFQNEIFLFD